MTGAVQEAVAGRRTGPAPALATGVCGLAGVKAGTAASVLVAHAAAPGTPGEGLGTTGALIAVALHTLLVGMVILRRRFGLAAGAVYVGYSSTVGLVQFPATPWNVVSLALGGALLVTAVALWAVGMDTVRRKWPLAGFGAGVAVGLAVGALLLSI